VHWIHVANADVVLLWRWGRSVCVPYALEGGVQPGVDVWGRHYVRAKSLKCATPTLKKWRFKTRFFASFLFAFEKK